MRAAFFDLDKTVIAKSSLLAWGPELHARGLLHRRTLVGAGIAQFWFQRFGADDKRLDRVRQAVLKVTRGWERDQIRQMVQETVNDVIEPLLYAEALELIDQHLAQGDEVYLVSSAPAEIVEPFAEVLRITGTISSIASVDDEGRFTGEMAFLARATRRPRRSRRSQHAAASTSPSPSPTPTRPQTCPCSTWSGTPSR